MANDFKQNGCLKSLRIANSEYHTTTVGRH